MNSQQEADYAAIDRLYAHHATLKNNIEEAKRAPLLDSWAPFNIAEVETPEGFGYIAYKKAHLYKPSDVRGYTCKIPDYINANAPCPTTQYPSSPPHMPLHR